MDYSEPVSFYVPGADHWWKKIMPPPGNFEEWEVQALVDLWSLDEQ